MRVVPVRHYNRDAKENHGTTQHSLTLLSFCVRWEGWNGMQPSSFESILGGLLENNITLQILCSSVTYSKLKTIVCNVISV